MDEDRHFKSFFGLYHRLYTICKNGGKGSNDALKVIGVMQFHYKNLTPQMYKYIEQFNDKLVELGYVFINSEGLPNFNNEEDKEAKITGKFENATLINECKNPTHPGQLKGAIFNYNEFSKSLLKVDKQELERIKNKTIQNIKFEQACLCDPQLRNRHMAKFRQQRKWGLPDSEKDW